MSEKPILFCGEMVRAILAGRKTQTRRVMKPQPELVEYGTGDDLGWACDKCRSMVTLPEATDLSPYGIRGDRLWVRETWSPWADGWTRSEMRTADKAVYQADYRDGTPAALVGGSKRWRPSIHMPRAMSRITLEVADVHVRRVNDISEEDSEAEGVFRGDNKQYANYPSGETVPGWEFPRESFRTLWDSINSERGFGWDANPFVWAITFKRVE